MGEQLRAAMPALANKTYFNYGGQGPLPDPSLRAILSCWQSIQDLGPFTTAVWPLVNATTTRLRERLGRWLGVPPARLAFTENVTSGCVLPLWGLPWQQGEALLLSDCEHPGVVAACQELARRHGLEVRQFRVGDLRGSPEHTETVLLERLEQALAPQTRLVVLSHLLWNTGQLLPMARVAERLSSHPRRPWLLVDGAQSLGSVPVAAAAVAADIYACTGHKWCCGPEGLGVVALSERLLAEAQPTLIGWRSLLSEQVSEPEAAPGGSPFHSDGRRFEVATSCIPLFAGLDCSLQLLEFLPEPVGCAAEALQALLRRPFSLQQLPGVEPLLEEPPPAGLVSFTLADGAGRAIKPEAIVDTLGEQAIWLRSLPEPACLRACTHITTTAADLERLLQALRGLQRS
ncbi:MAG: aminotransferase class V-fold PLP-dependent enzyme [Cyanobium sp.]